MSENQEQGPEEEEEQASEDEDSTSVLPITPADSEPLTLSELEQYLQKAANILRGSIDQADFKAYIFPLMFFKRISDVYLEEYDLALVDSGGDHEFAAFAENHRFAIPDGCLWQDVRERTDNIGQALITAFRGIEKANPETLYGIFGNAAWSNKEKLPDSKLADLIEHFSTKPLTNAAVSPDVFGQAYEFLIKKFADQSNKKAGEYYTPRSVVRMLVDILDPQESETVYDPACGTGGMLIEVIEHVKATGGNPQLLWGKLFGQEKSLATSGIARMNLLLHGVEDFKIVREDTLRSPGFFNSNNLAQFDCVIANPPFSLEKWGTEQWATDRWGRNLLGGVPPNKYADWAWVQHMMTSAAPGNGRVAVVLSQGALFRQGAEARIREHFLLADYIEAIIGLAKNLFYGTNVEACVVILRRKKPSDLREKVMFVNAETLFRSGRNQNTLEPEHTAAILDLYRRFGDVPGLAHLASFEDIRANGYNLSIPLYIEPADKCDVMTLEQAIAGLTEARRTAAASRAALETELTKWGLGV